MQMKAGDYWLTKYTEADSLLNLTVNLQVIQNLPLPKMNLKFFN